MWCQWCLVCHWRMLHLAPSALHTSRLQPDWEPWFPTASREGKSRLFCTVPASNGDCGKDGVSTISRLDQLSTEFGGRPCDPTLTIHMAKLSGVKLEADSRKAVWTDRAGTRHPIDAPARYCFSAWDGYWSNFRLADYVGAMFPESVSCGFE